MNISLNPKASFLAMESLAKQHRELVVSAGFTTTMQLALLQYQRRLFLDASSDPVIAAAQAQRLCGAQQFAEELLNLGEKPEPPKLKPDPHALVPTK